MTAAFLRSSPALALALALAPVLLGNAASSHAVWGWMRGAALTDFQASDWTLLKEAAGVVLNEKPDGEQVNWSNPETGNRGSIIALVTFTHEGQTCRRAAMRNLTHRGREDRAAYSLCQQTDGEWVFVSESALLGEGRTNAETIQEDANPEGSAAATMNEGAAAGTATGDPIENDAG
ncbi:MAG: RT0821/Lpp0805 family surface protein [Pseudomonadota bacterium]